MGYLNNIMNKFIKQSDDNEISLEKTSNRNDVNGHFIFPSQNLKKTELKK